VSFSDPWGLCPPKDTNVQDCGTGNLADAWRILDGSNYGRSVIASAVSAGYDVKTFSDNSCGLNNGKVVNNCLNHSTTEIFVRDRSPAAVAMGITHELVHAEGKAVVGTEAFGHEEAAGWAQAFGTLATMKNPADQAAGATAYRDELSRLKQLGDRKYYNEKFCAASGEDPKRVCR
jgi:hypothetical protein